MKTLKTIRARPAEAGVALLISIFILLLISVVAIALIVSSSTESALAGNYRASTDVYYGAIAGIEEARGRLSTNDPNSFKTTWAAFYPPPGTTLPIGTVGYVLNPGPTESAGALLTTYQDTEYASEFGVAPSPTPPTTLSVWNKTPLTTNLSFPPPLYKWVRINAVSEQSLKLADTYPFIDGTQDNTPLYYDGTHLTDTNCTSCSQVFEITALAVLPNGNALSSQKIVQYLVAPQTLNWSFPAALTLDGNTPLFGAPTSPSYWVKGIDQGSVGTCNPGSPSIAVGYTDTSYSVSSFEPPSDPHGIPATLFNHYTNGGATIPDIVAVTLPPNLSTVGGLNTLVQTITANADVVINRNATSADMPAAMSSSNPMTIVINGDLVLSSWRNTGYGLLLVTGLFTYDPDASWDGVILVIGKGRMYSFQNSYTTTQIQGAVLLANTVGLPPSSVPNSSNFEFDTTPNTLANGIYYSSCWIQAAKPNLPYNILSFHEISQ